MNNNPNGEDSNQNNKYYLPLDNGQYPGGY